MRKFIKKKGKTVKAYMLGGGSDEELHLIDVGLLARDGDDWRVYSTEAVNGEGELAHTGDMFKVDANGNPYPNERGWFDKNHRVIDAEKNLYEQIPSPVSVWLDGEEKDDVIEYILSHNLLTLNENDSDKYYSAFLWGAQLSAPRNAAVVIYSCDRGINGEITEVSFNLVARDIFDTDYIPYE